MTARILTCGLFAGFLAGLLGAVLQFVFVQPLLLHAELYESGELIYEPQKARRWWLMWPGSSLCATRCRRSSWH